MAILNATIHYNSGLSVKELEESLETDERTTRCKVQSLELGENDEGHKATIAEFKKSDKKGLGKLSVVKTEDGEDGELFNAIVFIRTQEAKVSVSRES